MLNATDLRSGTTFELNGTPYVVTRYTHTKMGRGGATIRVEARNLKTGNVEEKTFGSGDKVPQAQTRKQKMQFLYKDDQKVFFMDSSNFGQIEIASRILGGDTRFLKEGQSVDVFFWNDEPLFVSLPPNVALEVIDTVPGVRGNSATNVWKPATLEGGFEVKVPLFIKVGERIRVDTRTGEYVERVK